MTSSTGPDGRRVYFVHNWSWLEQSVAVPRDLVDVLDADGSLLESGSALFLGAWDVRVLATPPLPPSASPSHKETP